MMPTAIESGRKPRGSTVSSSSSYNVPFGYTSREHDPETGLMYFRARYYDPHTAEFISPDPLEYVDGMSLFRGYFVPNDVDSWGLDLVPGDLWPRDEPTGCERICRIRKDLDPKTDYVKCVWKCNNPPIDTPVSPPVIESEQTEESGMLRNCACTVIFAIQADVCVPEPSDAAPPKWICYAVAGSVAGVVIICTAKGCSNPPPPPKIVEDDYWHPFPDGGPPPFPWALKQILGTPKGRIQGSGYRDSSQPHYPFYLKAAIRSDDRRFLNVTKTRAFLAASVPCKTFDFLPLSKDGRGGWTFSQFGSDRYTARPNDFGLKVGLAICVSPKLDGDYIEYSVIKATVHDKSPVESKLDWKKPNSGGSHHNEVSIYEWIQDIQLPIDRSGLIQLNIWIKLASCTYEIEVEGSCFVHATVMDDLKE